MHVNKQVVQVKKRIAQVKGVAAAFGGLMGRRKRLTAAVVVAALLFGPLLLTGDGELFVLNAVGLGFGALLLRRFARPTGRKRTGRAQRNYGTEQARHTAKVQQQQGGHDDDGNNDDWWDWDKAMRKPGRAGGPADGGAVQRGA